MTDRELLIEEARNFIYTNKKKCLDEGIGMPFDCDAMADFALSKKEQWQKEAMEWMIRDIKQKPSAEEVDRYYQVYMEQLELSHQAERV